MCLEGMNRRASVDSGLLSFLTFGELPWAAASQSSFLGSEGCAGHRNKAVCRPHLNLLLLCSSTTIDSGLHRWFCSAAFSRSLDVLGQLVAEIWKHAEHGPSLRQCSLLPWGSPMLGKPSVLLPVSYAVSVVLA